MIRKQIILLMILVIFFVHSGKAMQNQSLFEACHDEKNKISLEVIKNLIENKADINEENTTKDTPFHKICMNKNVTPDIIQCLIDNKANINAKDIDNSTPLYFACRINLDIIPCLINNKADVNIKNSMKNTPLHGACYNVNITLNSIKYLIENKAQINTEDGIYESPFHLACKNKNITLDIIKYFLLDNIIDKNSLKKSFDLLKKNNQELYNDIKDIRTLSGPQLFKELCTYNKNFKTICIAFLLSTRILVKNKVKQILPKPILFIILNFAIPDELKDLFYTLKEYYDNEN